MAIIMVMRLWQEAPESHDRPALYPGDNSVSHDREDPPYRRIDMKPEA